MEQPSKPQQDQGPASADEDQARLSLAWSLGIGLDELDRLDASALMRIAAERIERDSKITQHVNALAQAARSAGFDGSSGQAMVAFIRERLSSAGQSREFLDAWNIASSAFDRLRTDLGREESPQARPAVNEAVAWSQLLQEAGGRIKAQQTTIELLAIGAIRPDFSSKRDQSVRPTF